MNNTNPQTTRKPKWDENNSFYKWKIHLSNGKVFTGYSKSEDKPEVHNKVSLFCRKMIMLKNKGYFNPARPYDLGKLKYIEFYKRTGLREYNEKLCYLYLDSFVLCENQDFNVNVIVEKFLKHFYNLVKLGKIDTLDYSYVDYSNMEHEEERAFSMKPGRFRDALHVHEHCKQLILNNIFPEERILKFQRDTIEKYFTSSAESDKRLEEAKKNLAINFTKAL